MGFKKAKREQVWLKVLLSGPSGSGKSYSALRLAKGVFSQCGGNGIAYIGTESSRNKYYADEFDYDLSELDEPFECKKYMNAIDEAIDLGYKVLIIDSLTHEWKWLNDTHDKMPGNSFTNWGKLKPMHHEFMEKVLRSPIHIIATARGKDEWLLEEKNGKQVPKKVGLGQQQEKDISYEYTLSLNIAQDTHIASVDKDNTKLFEGKFEVLTEKHGVKLYEWANNGETPEVKKEKDTYKKVDSSPEEILNDIKKEIISLCASIGGSKNSELMEVLRKYTKTKTGNPNSIKDLETAKECLEAIKGVKPLEEGANNNE